METRRGKDSVKSGNNFSNLEKEVEVARRDSEGRGGCWSGGRREEEERRRKS